MPTCSFLAKAGSSNARTSQHAGGSRVSSLAGNIASIFLIFRRLPVSPALDDGQGPHEGHRCVPPSDAAPVPARESIVIDARS
jgi:hypothetical protein